MESNERHVKKPMDISKELEITNIKVLRKKSKVSYLKQDFEDRMVRELHIQKENGYEMIVKQEDDKKKNTIGKENSQFRLFQTAMKHLLIFGQCIGLNPVTMITEEDLSKIKFVVNSWHFIYSGLTVIIQTIITCSYFKILFSNPVSIKSLGYMSFNFSVWCTMFNFVRIATKWHILLKELNACNLDEYVDLSVIRKVKIICIVTLCLALLEQSLDVFAKVIQICENETYGHGLYEELIRQTFPWLFDNGVPYYMPLGILLQIRAVIANMYWNYPDVFIVCISLYLASILKQINKKITWAADKIYLSPSIWATLREDYTRATRLVRQFDDVFSGLILVSFASKVFFINLQLFSVIANGIHSTHTCGEKFNNFATGFLRGYENVLYLVYSLAFLFAKFLTVSLVAASVNATSMLPASVLHRIPSYAFCNEVQRFLDQIHGDFVALSGLKFFYVTRDLVLTVAGTIVTYELVLLQFNSDDLNQT